MEGSERVMEAAKAAESTAKQAAIARVTEREVATVWTPSRAE